MNSTIRLCGLLLLILVSLSAARAQVAGGRVVRTEIKFVGPQSVTEELIRSNVRVKPGDPFLRPAVDDDVRNLYATGLFYNIQVAEARGHDGVTLTYIVQPNPRLTEIKFQGNKKYRNTKLQRKISSKVGEPLNERKLFTDAQEIEKMYQKAGYPGTKVRSFSTVIEETGRATATFEIAESPKVKIIEVEFPGATAFPEKKLRSVIKTRKHWMFSWITGSGYLKEDQMEEDRERLGAFYRDEGYIDFDLHDVQIDNPTPRTMVVRFHITEGRQYRVGSIKFEGNKIFTLTELTNGLRQVHFMKGGKGELGPNGLPMDVGSVFTPKGLRSNVEAIEDFYGSKGYIDVGNGRNLSIIKVPNVQSGTMDLEFRLQEGPQSFIEKIEIRGNNRTKDKVIRRELAVYPGEVFDMVRVKRSKQRLEGLQYFEKVDTRPEATDVGPNRKDLVIGVDEKNTGNLSVGAGFSTVDSIVGFAEFSQGNFDLFHPPTFTGGGQKFRLRMQLGTERQDYLASFIEPWFTGRKLALGVDLYYRDLSYESLDDIYDVTRAGARMSLTRALGSDFLIGSVSYTLENVGIHLNGGYNEANTPPSIYDERGYSLLSRVGGSLAFDTRNSVQLPDKGQRTELSGEIVGGPFGGEEDFYKLELKSAWYFRGFVKGHVLEVVGRTGAADELSGDSVPFYERYYLGGLYSLRGFKYRSVSPRDPGYDEPVGGNTYWFGTAEYSIPIIERLRFALFYDIGAVNADSYDFDASNYSDNWGIGLRLNLPIGPLRLDYGFPINHDEYNSGSGRFQFGVGYTREF